jgi:hypothetical protein
MRYVDEAVFNFKHNGYQSKMKFNIVTDWLLPQKNLAFLFRYYNNCAIVYSNIRYNKVIVVKKMKYDDNLSIFLYPYKGEIYAKKAEHCISMHFTEAKKGEIDSIIYLTHDNIVKEFDLEIK